MYTSQNKLLEEKLQLLDKIDLPGVHVALNETNSIDPQEVESERMTHEKQLEQCYLENLKQPLKCHSEVRNFLRQINHFS